MYGGPGIFPSARGQATTTFTLQSGQTMLIPPGNWLIGVGPYTTIQELNQVTSLWTPLGADGRGLRYVASDGNNFRIVNTTGCAVGAVVGTAGSGYTSTPTVTVSAGGGTFAAIVGGALGTITVTNAGSSYTYPPLVSFQAPSYGLTAPAIPASGYSTLSGTTLSTVTLTNAGAGYTFVPNVILTNDPRDITGTGATATVALTGANTITAVVCTNIGTGGLTAIPTLSFSGGGGSSAAATVVMDWTITAYAATGAGNGYTAPVLVTGAGGLVATTAVNPTFDKNLVTLRQANIQAALTATGITATGQVVIDGGRYSALPTALIQTNYAPATVATLTLTMGGVTDTVFMMASA
jgi:hypothetical protein